MKKYLVSFDSLGVEAIIDLTELDEQFIFDKLHNSDATSPINSLISRIILRAQFNPQRNPEVWIIDVNDDVAYKDVVSISKDTPREFTDFTRKNGLNIFGAV